MYDAQLAGLVANVPTALSRPRAPVTQTLLLALPLLSISASRLADEQYWQERRLRLRRTFRKLGQKDFRIRGKDPRLNGADRRWGFHNDQLLYFGDLIHVY